jgi:hypothetical protein
VTPLRSRCGRMLDHPIRILDDGATGLREVLATNVECDSLDDGTVLRTFRSASRCPRRRQGRD